MTPKICISILPNNLSEAKKLIAKAHESRADFIEVRLDLLNEASNLKDLTANTKVPLIATNKLKSEKGFFSGTEDERQQTLLVAAQNGFQYIDIDFNIPKRVENITKLKELGAKIIVSYHKYDGILNVASLEKILDGQIALGADICKIVLTAKQFQDNLSVLSFVSFASVKAKLVCFCMSPQGKISRLLSAVLGATFTFASLDGDSSTASGQMTIKEMRTAYKLLGI